MSQTKREIQTLLAEAGIRPLKRYGQHFLIDGNLMEKLIDGAGVTSDDIVLEVGPGTGALTDLLVEAAGHVAAVEIDRGLHGLLKRRFRDNPCLTLLHQDVLSGKTTIAPEVISIVTALSDHFNKRCMLVANLPYQIATPLLVNLLMAEEPISPFCFTVQAEVGDRFGAEVGSKEYGPVSIFVQAMGRVERIAKVPPGAFWPVPKIDSSMLRIDVDRKLSTPLRASLHRVVHTCFNHRRKKIKWSLQKEYGPEIYADFVASGQWDPSLRPERLTPEQWLALAEYLTKAALELSGD